MALVAKESILVIIFPGKPWSDAALCAWAGQVLVFAGRRGGQVEPFIVADAEIHGQLSALPRYSLLT
jgi:hypothetical protein